MRYESSKRKLRTIWNDTYANEDKIFKLQEHFTKIENLKEVSSILRDKKINEFLYEGIFNHDFDTGIYGIEFTIEFPNTPKKHIPFIKSALLIDLPENFYLDEDYVTINKFFIQRTYDVAEYKEQIGFNYIIGCTFLLDTSRMTYTGVIVDENFQYIRYDIPYKLLVSISNQKEYV